ncbi:hypothetical protein LK542_08795 [Massilia sp. IC2-477]|uniref:T6SS immunity protein Tli4 family protein n=1 Tax=Massilia sp. IC2-477 TaxID=2887198 RepID=UPI001D10D868|nr:T6SS immunity protein Tli4 family protein [Massilia sp. IC2-477]MCC2955710.1 hypothetical protein [Massilia sp. IC2-477]
MSTAKRLILVPLIAATLAVAACDLHPKEWKTPNMTPLAPRLQSVFEKTKTICFGRFMVDVPASAVVAWGDAAIPLGVSILHNGANEVNALAQKFIDELNSEKAIYLDDIPLLIAVDNLIHPEGRIVTGYSGFESIGELKIHGYFKMNNDGVVVDARPLKDRRDQVISDITSIARRLRQRSETEVPTEPGNCIENAFLPDEPSTGKEHRNEHVSVGFRLKEFPDTHLSIKIRPSHPHKNESNSLKWQLERLEKNLKAEDPNHPRLKTKYFRRGDRQIHEWVDGFEALSRSPEQADIHGIHDFGMDFPGVPFDPLKPYTDIRMQTGVANNAAGATKPSLTDEEAIAVWDKITSTIRVRPTGAAAVKTAGSDPEPRFPLGELAATGRTCPQTGLWESNEPSAAEGGRRRHFKAGDVMPRIATVGTPSFWQRLRGEKPAYQLATVWKLVRYDDVPHRVNSSAPSITQALGANETTNDTTGGDAAANLSDEIPSKQRG